MRGRRPAREVSERQQPPATRERQGDRRAAGQERYLWPPVAVPLGRADDLPPTTDRNAETFPCCAAWDFE